MSTKAIVVQKGSRVVTVGGKVKRHHRKKKFTLPLGVVAGFTPEIMRIWRTTNGLKSPGNALRCIAEDFAGVGLWSPGHVYISPAKAFEGWLPVLLGIAAHAIVGQRLGVNRMIARMGIPIVRI